MRFLPLLMACLFLTACSETAMTPVIRLMMDEEMEDRVETITTEVINRDRNAIGQQMAAAYSDEQIEAGLTDLFANLPDGEPESFAPIRYNFRTQMSLNDDRSGSLRTVEVVMRLDYGYVVGYLTIGLRAEPGENYRIATLWARTNGELSPAGGRDI